MNVKPTAKKPLNLTVSKASGQFVRPSMIFTRL
jgi:hypothetical protein